MARLNRARSTDESGSHRPATAKHCLSSSGVRSAGEIFSHIPFEGMFCKNCNTQVKLRESRETRGYEEAVLACFDTDSTWNLHVDEKLRRDLPDGSARVKVLGAPGDYEVDWWSPKPEMRTGSRSNVVSSTTSRNLRRSLVWLSEALLQI